MTNIEKQYEGYLKKIDLLMKKGEANLNDNDVSVLQAMITAVAQYEDENIVLPTLKTIAEMVELRLFL